MDKKLFRRHAEWQQSASIYGSDPYELSVKQILCGSEKYRDRAEDKRIWDRNDEFDESIFFVKGVSVC